MKSQASKSNAVAQVCAAISELSSTLDEIETTFTIKVISNEVIFNHEMLQNVLLIIFKFFYHFCDWKITIGIDR